MTTMTESRVDIALFTRVNTASTSVEFVLYLPQIVVYKPGITVYIILILLTIDVALSTKSTMVMI